MSTIKLNNENFEKEVNKSPILVIVDCWAEWCPPCRMFAPIFDELSKEYKGKLKFCKLNTQENMELARKFTILSIPTLLFFKKGKEIDRLVGAMPKEVLREKIEKILNR